jgi:hypothetical protein
MIDELIDLEAEKKHETEILDWCDEHGYDKCVAALILTYDLDLEENDKFEIRELNINSKDIEYGDHIYRVFNEEALDEKITAYQEEFVESIIEKTPAEIREYIDWDYYWDKNSPDIYDFCDDAVMFHETYETMYILNVDNDSKYKQK